MTNLTVKNIYDDFTFVDTFYIKKNSEGKECIWKKTEQIMTDGSSKVLQDSFLIGYDHRIEIQTKEDGHKFLIDFLHKIEDSAYQDIDPDDLCETVIEFHEEKKVKKTNTMIFNSVDSYFAWTEQFENCSEYEEIPVAVDDGFKVAMDMTTTCRSWKTALKRFEKIFSKVNKEVTVWIESIRESAENGCFVDTTGCHPAWTDDPEEIKEFLKNGAYSYGIEKVDDGRWYIYLNISGCYAGR